MKNTLQKKEVFQDNFIHNWCYSGHNHPEGFSWWKRKAQRDYRRKIKKETRDMIMED